MKLTKNKINNLEKMLDSCKTKVNYNAVYVYTESLKDFGYEVKHYQELIKFCITYNIKLK